MSERTSAAVRVSEVDGLARVTVGSGLRRNALTSSGWAAVERVFRDLAHKTALRAVILDGAGGTFCAGSDMREWIDATMEDIELSFARMEAACTAIETLPVPVIAKVRGFAAGAGCQMALACDLRVLAEDASIGMPIARLGILVSPPYALRLSMLVGPGPARDLLYTGRMITAAEAVRLGLATTSAPDSELDAVTDRIVDTIMRQSVAAVRGAKRAVNAILTGPRLAAAAASQGPPVDYADFSQGINRFLRHGEAAESP